MKFVSPLTLLLLITGSVAMPAGEKLQSVSPASLQDVLSGLGNVLDQVLDGLSGMSRVKILYYS